jgi:hypothetical protein
MEPIISPWVIYLMFLSQGFSIFLIITGIIVACVSAIWLLLYYVENDAYSHDIKPVPKLLILYGVITLGLGLLIPNKETCLQMLVAKNITTNRVVKAGKVISNSHDILIADVVKIITAIKKDTK